MPQQMPQWGQPMAPNPQFAQGGWQTAPAQFTQSPPRTATNDSRNMAINNPMGQGACAQACSGLQHTAAKVDCFEQAVACLKTCDAKSEASTIAAGQADITLPLICKKFGIQVTGKESKGTLTQRLLNQPQRQEFIEALCEGILKLGNAATMKAWPDFKRFNGQPCWTHPANVGVVINWCMGRGIQPGQPVPNAVIHSNARPGQTAIEKALSHLVDAFKAHNLTDGNGQPLDIAATLAGAFENAAQMLTNYPPIASQAEKYLESLEDLFWNTENAAEAYIAAGLPEAPAEEQQEGGQEAEEVPQAEDAAEEAEQE